MAYSKLPCGEVTLVPADIPFEVMRGSFTDQRFAPHAHDTYVIGTMERGTARVNFKGRDELHRAGGVVTICPGEVHTGETVDRDGWAYRMLYIPSALMQRFTGTGAAPAFAASGAHDADLAERIAALHVHLEGPASARSKAISLETVMATLCERHALRGGRGAQARPTERMAGVRRFIDQNSMRHLTLDALAAVGEMGKYQLIREFKRAYGMPPYAYLELVRVMRARAMLQAGERTSDVAALAGYADQSHLSRQFKAVLGVTPARYARSYGHPLRRASLR